MGKPAARLGDMQVCPMFDGPKPHVGGPIVGPGAPTVLIGGAAAALVSDMCTCSGPPSTIAVGSTGVFIEGLPAARSGDITSHGGSILPPGLPTVLIGEAGGAALSPTAASALRGAAPTFPASGSAAGAFGGVALAQPSVGAATLGAAAGAASAIRRSSADRSWVRARLVYRDGSPAGGVACRVTLSDGTSRVLVSNSQGDVSLGSLQPGSCEFTIVDLDGPLWEKRC